jgi:acetylornithine deacetylase/succinyl-diaminopimelate desuccinylase-like protein
MDLEDLLSVLVSHDSVFGNEKSLSEWLLWYLKKEGFDTHKVNVAKNRFSIFARRGEGVSKLLLYGHMDTVPVYEGWQDDPFTLTRSGDRLYGLGACDMKGGIAALLFAMQSIDKKMPVSIFLAVDEENDSEGTWALAKNHIELLQGFSWMLSTEPGASKNKVGGAEVLTLGRRGRARYLVTIRGYSAHGGHIDRGINAVSVASKIVERIDNMRVGNHKILGPGSQFTARIKSEARGLSLPEYCELEVDRHTVMPETTQSCLEELKAVCDRVLIDENVDQSIRNHVSITVEVKRRKNDYMEPYFTPRNNSFAQRCELAIRSEVGEVVYNYGRSVGDENIFANRLGLMPVIIGPEGGNVHSPNEWVSYQSLVSCANIYKKILLSL